MSSGSREAIQRGYELLTREVKLSLPLCPCAEHSGGNGRWKTTVIHTVIIHSVINQESRNMVDRDLGLLLESPLGIFA